jgi:7,8-dihydropterin-6-yl-methyl-4-(beta-D-ribofuranosyl)aminobenzene 5'-phosphate synthase
MADYSLHEIDKVEILTLVDNYINMVSQDNSDIISRATSFIGNRMGRSILAEHGFSALVRTTTNGTTRTILFDFGFSPDVAARNAEMLEVDLGEVEAVALSHGHMDHWGGVATVANKIGKKGLEFVAHPVVFRSERYTIRDDKRIDMPTPDKRELERYGFKVVETKNPYLLLGGDVLFLGEVPRKTAFEKGMTNAYFDEGGKRMIDRLEDDTALVMRLKNKGLVVLSGCAHSGIINTVEHARQVTGVEKVHVVMGGFHLTGPAFEPIIDDTLVFMSAIAPDFIVPAHCTGRKAVLAFEQAMPDKFIVNMPGTRLTFSA